MVSILDSSIVGIYYICMSFLSSMVGFSFSLAMSLELSGPYIIFNEFFYYMNVTSHGLVMVFFFLTLLASGFSNFFLPHMCFQDDMALPSINLVSLWIILVSVCSVIFSLVLGDGVMTGWTLYTPISSKKYSNSISVDYLILGIHLFSLSSILGSMNIMITTYLSLDYYISLLALSPFIWGFMTTSFLIIFSTPSLSCAVTMLLFDSTCNSFYFMNEFGGDPVLYQIMFWVWGHPEVYILVLPVFGVVSQIIQSVCGVMHNRIGVMCSMISLSMLSFLVWGHHMVTVGWSVDLKGYFMTSTIAISFPTSVKVFSWIFSLILSNNFFSLPLCFFSLFLFFFSLGGVSGLFLSNSSLDMMLHDGYFVVGHFHYVLANASVLGFVSGWFFFFSNFFNFNYCFKSSLWFCTGFSFFLIILFTPFHSLGFLGLPSSVYIYPFEYFVLFYLSNMGFLGVWVNYVVFLWSFLKPLLCCHFSFFSFFNIISNVDMFFVIFILFILFKLFVIFIILSHIL